MNPASEPGLLDAVLDCWERNNAVLINLLRAIPEDGLQARALPGSPTAGQMYAHLHHERMVSVLENAPEHAGVIPAEEWRAEHDRQRIHEWLVESCQRVRAAVLSRIQSGRGLDKDFAHPIQLIPFLIFHESYHHGQIKLALKAAGSAIPDKVAGPLVWDVWRAR